MKPKRLSGSNLATVYAAYLGVKLNQKPGAVWASYDGGGWIVARGESLIAHPDMRAQYPNGWSLMHRVRSGKARAELAEAIK